MQRENTVTFRLSDAELTALRTAAQADHRPVGNFVRNAALTVAAELAKAAIPSGERKALHD